MTRTPAGTLLGPATPHPHYCFEMGKSGQDVHLVFHLLSLTEYSIFIDQCSSFAQKFCIPSSLN